MHNGIDFNATIVFVLLYRDVFLHGGIFVIEVFSYTILDETCTATDVLLIAVVTCDFVDDVSSLVQVGFRNGALVSGACTFRGVVGESSSEGV